MRTHADIVRAANPAVIAAQRCVSIHTARSWILRDSIPAEHWAWFAEQRHASLDELAEAAALRAEKAAA